VIDCRLRIVVTGAVQGVGYRPFVYRAATNLGLKGWVLNSPEGVVIEVEGNDKALAAFERTLRTEKPPQAVVQGVESWRLDAVGFEGFEIRQSEESGTRTALVVPDLATCQECILEISDPSNRRYRYPFTNCTNCGPRYSIMQALPYDRPNTTMKGFRMCPRCQAEYDDPGNRRFHAQPNACPACGPRVELWSPDGDVVARNWDAIVACAEAVRDGRIVAVKGLGGYHLVCDAFNEDAIKELRRRKNRELKPLAVMAPSLEDILNLCEVSQAEKEALTSVEAPIVLLKRRSEGLAPSVAPGNPYLGVMLPYTPLHHLLFKEIGRMAAATSGNLSDEPICIDEREALQRLKGIADLFLVHNRPIQRQVDDSIVRVIENRLMVLRRSRGFAPLPVPLPAACSKIVGLGAHLKSTVAVAIRDKAFLSQHIGDLETVEAIMAFDRVVSGLENLYGVNPEIAACDGHPDYASTRKAFCLGIPVVQVQHHLAHALACAADNDLEPPFLAVTWDGTGLGTDGTIWGGEFLLVRQDGWDRAGWLRPFRLPGGDQAVRQPWRTAASILVECGIEPSSVLGSIDCQGVEKQLKAGVNCPVTTSAGRLFDAISALLGVCAEQRFEGQAAMELEFCASGQTDEFVWPEAPARPPLILDWRPIVKDVIDQAMKGRPRSQVAMFFHKALASGIAQTAQRIGEKRVLLTGGCFQNRILLENAIRNLRNSGLEPYWHQRIPPNDGGLAVGQIVEAIRQRRKPCA